MARKIGQMLHAREPKIVNGPGEFYGSLQLGLCYLHISALAMLSRIIISI